MLQNLITSRNAKFYRVNNPISDTFVDELFKTVSTDKVGNYTSKIIRENRNNSVKIIVSFLVYKFEDEPSFLKGSGVKETKYAFLLLVEYEDYLIVCKKNTAGYEDFLDKKCEPLRYEEINGLFSNEDPSYEKINLSNMGVSKSAISRRTLESKDLKGQIGSLTSRRAITNSTTVKTKDHRHILRPHSSGITKTEGSANFTDLLKWISDIVVELNKGVQSNEFLDGFATPINYEAIRETLIPNALVLNTNSILDLLSGPSEILINGKSISKNKLHNFLDILNSTFYIDSDKNIYLLNSRDKRIILGKIDLNTKSITLKSKWLKAAQIIHADYHPIEIQKLLNDEQEFSVTFTNPDIIYKNKNVFKDKGFAANCAELEAALVSINFINTITSEKADDDMSIADTNFKDYTVFSEFQKKIWNKTDILVCDDLGDEWADFICFDNVNPNIKLFHCKHGKSSTAASQLHIVISQALKNLGRTSFSANEIKRKIASWNKTYTGSNINLIRSSHTTMEIESACSNIISSPMFGKEVAIVTPFLSATELKNEFTKLSAGQKVPHHIPQLVWLLSTFVFSCKEAGIKPAIYCSI